LTDIGAGSQESAILLSCLGSDAAAGSNLLEVDLSAGKAGNLRYVHDAYYDRFDILYNSRKKQRGSDVDLMNEQLNECDVD